MILSFDRTSNEPESRQIYRQLRSRIETGQLAPGQSLPAALSMARQMKLPRSTIERAYQLLVAANIIQWQIDRYVVTENENSHAEAVLESKRKHSGSFDSGGVQWAAVLPTGTSYLNKAEGKSGEWVRISLFSVSVAEGAGLQQLNLVRRWVEEQSSARKEPALLLTELNQYLVSTSGIEVPEVDALVTEFKKNSNQVDYAIAGQLRFADSVNSEYQRLPPGLGELPGTKYISHIKSSFNAHAMGVIHEKLAATECRWGEPLGAEQLQAELSAAADLHADNILQRLDERFYDYCNKSLEEAGSPVLVIKKQAVREVEMS
jgi:DNA-binding transcriptional regulator YhcF (GntR family)